MPEFTTPDAPEQSVQSSKTTSKVIVLRPLDLTKRGKVVLRPPTYQDAMILVHKHFNIQTGCSVALLTNELDVCQSAWHQLTEDVWPIIFEDLTQIVFEESAPGRHPQGEPSEQPKMTINVVHVRPNNPELVAEWTLLVKATTPLQKLFDGIAGKLGMSEDKLHFFYKGETIECHTDTPVDFGMEDGDKIQ
ncbi:hypothetical protein BDV98DRAFT_653876, partial [Pterulicium gracile]